MTVSELVPSRYYALVGAIVVTLIALAAALFDWRWLLLAAAAGLASAVGVRDLLQTRRAVLRNYPILAHIRFFFETIRPEIRQYLLEGDNEAVPFSRAQRSLVYQRAKSVEDRQPFGTGKDVYLAGYEWINHSLRPVHIADTNFRVMVGGNECKQPYSCSVFNISAMSFGALSANAVRALNKGAKLGGFAHDTGEGSISRYHREYGGDLIWEIGSGYFGCRTPDGKFDPEKFADFTGSYELGPGQTRTVFADGDKLFIERKGKKEELFPETSELFFRKGVEGRILFRHDDRDKVEALIDRRNNEDVVWRKMK